MIRECNNSNGPEGKLLELILKQGALKDCKKTLVLAMGLDEFCSYNGLFWLPAILVKILLDFCSVSKMFSVFLSTGIFTKTKRSPDSQIQIKK